MNRRGRILVALLLPIASALAPGCSETQSDPAEHKVYTNKDLEELPRPSALPATPDEPSAPRGAAPPGTERVEPAGTRAESAKERRIAEGERRVAAAQARVDELEKRLRAIHNPFLPRPQLPPEEAQAWKGLNGVQRATRVEGQLEQARKELSAAQEALARLRAASQP